MRPKELGPTGMTREEELKLQQDFIEKNGVTKLPPDARLKDPPDWSSWKKNPKAKKKPKKPAKAKKVQK